ncbi:putative DNA-binding prophage protein [Yersinia pestis PY-42]|nr:putative DNA-binding prophage protein [Yersinia pestis Angola]EDR40948.1 putative DNA-binding prophage protein [Yersinia pestis biovar Orientalis str. F1991016]EDR61888.1 putative DNA-binding prophage protein [Yersinia pestis biovar Antiqua str. UG05-0454]EIR94130.1 putative DNA-binding prophage protein [Yersinia pestis PY-42]
MAKKAGVSRETLYRTLSPSGNPTLKTLLSVVSATGFQFSHLASITA